MTLSALTTAKRDGTSPRNAGFALVPVILVLAVVGIVGVYYLNFQSIGNVGRTPEDPAAPVSPPENSQYCESASDCVAVSCECHCSGCGGFSYEEIINKDSVDQWYKEHACKPARVCPKVCCNPIFIACENNTCLVKPKTRENIPKELLDKEALLKGLCEETRGVWQDGKTWIGGCSCPKEAYFKENNGCVSMKSDCDRFQGQWFPKGTACDAIPIELEDSTLRKNCEKSGKLIFDRCLCPNGKFWDYQDRCRASQQKVGIIERKFPFGL